MKKQDIEALAREAARTLKSEADVDTLSGRFRKTLEAISRAR